MAVLNLSNGTKIKIGQISEFNPAYKDFKRKFWIPRFSIALKELERLIRKKNKLFKLHCVYNKGRVISVYATEGDKVIYGSMFSINEEKSYISAKTYMEAKSILGDLLHLYHRSKRATVKSLLRKADKKLKEVLNNGK